MGITSTRIFYASLSFSSLNDLSLLGDLIWNVLHLVWLTVSCQYMSKYYCIYATVLFLFVFVFSRPHSYSASVFAPFFSCQIAQRIQWRSQKFQLGEALSLFPSSFLSPFICCLLFLSFLLFPSLPRSSRFLVRPPNTGGDPQVIGAQLYFKVIDPRLMIFIASERAYSTFCEWLGLMITFAIFLTVLEIWPVGWNTHIFSYSPAFNHKFENVLLHPPNFVIGEPRQRATGNYSCKKFPLTLKPKYICCGRTDDNSWHRRLRSTQNSCSARPPGIPVYSREFAVRKIPAGIPGNFYELTFLH